MKIYLISQDVNNDYDTYDSAVVAAESEEGARTIHPDEIIDRSIRERSWKTSSTWAQTPEQVKVLFLGTAKKDTKEGIILASFHAG